MFDWVLNAPLVFRVLYSSSDGCCRVDIDQVMAAAGFDIHQVIAAAGNFPCISEATFGILDTERLSS